LDFKTEIIEFMEQKCQIQSILTNALPKDRLQKIRIIGINPVTGLVIYLGKNKKKKSDQARKDYENLT